MTAKKGGKPGRPAKYNSRRSSIPKQLQGDPECNHRGQVEIHTNSKGKNFKECGRCAAFLGWA